MMREGLPRRTVFTLSRALAALAVLAAAAILTGPVADPSLFASISPRRLEARPGGESTVVLTAGKFLVARGSMRDPNFSGTVIYLVQYNLLGTLGVVLNRPTDIRVSDALPDVKWLKGSPVRLLWGGPVEGTKLTILALSKVPIHGAVHVHGDLYAGWDINVFRDFFKKDSGDIRAVRAYGGYAGWAPGQLAAEVERGGWRVMDADEAEIFKDTSRLWYRLIGRP